MNKTINKLKDGVLFGIGALFVFGIANAWVNLSTVGPGDSLTDTIWNEMVGKINENGNKIEPLTNSGGNIGIGTTNPTRKLEVNGNIKASDPLISTDLATKNYVDTTISSSSSSYSQTNCTWKTITSCGLSCGNGTYYENFCGAGYYMAGFGLNTANSLSANNFKIYCCQ
ncbi:MAG: hypothetical protein PHS49_03980 [Candidatus Gracilibacteria bacterium]|nr:hypothetical protein [Candidatus Gracilibacteria bacterium]